jgi:hypothetical protein
MEYRVSPQTQKRQQRKVGSKRWQNICTHDKDGKTCTSSAVSGYDFCTKHGGGRRCTHDKDGETCTSSAISGYDFCKKHGGGRRCTHDKDGETCKTAAVSGYDFCKKHGGGPRCTHHDEDGNKCKTSAAHGYDFCTKHGGGRRCTHDKDGETCTSSARTGYDFCTKHGGGHRCASEACSVYDIPDSASYHHNDKYLCWNCFQQMYGGSNKWSVRQEHLCLAEIQRTMEKALKAIWWIWDCPIKCTLKKPDLMYELDEIFVSFEIDERGHDQSIERILEFRNILKKPFIMVRINPNLASKPLLKQIKRSNGHKIWQKTDNFEKSFIELKEIVFREIEIIKNRNYRVDRLPPYTEIGFNFDKYPDDRTDIIPTKNGFIIYE